MTSEPATLDDIAVVLPMMRDYCVFYEVAVPPDERLEAMARALIAADEGEGMLLVARDGDGPPVGFAAIGWKWSSLRGAQVAILEDLFVQPDARGSGAGRALITSAAERARRHGAPCLMWVTAHDNTRAQALYDSLDAESSSWLEYELELEN